ncbi:MAG: tRNA1(Val) (adenine(37)-N6)-methyltransferase [Syntrophales bacterium]|nr:tRNA1(Val) (adenine(37)-N6)-methyltransferase [Syntrophales bacterium]
MKAEETLDSLFNGKLRFFQKKTGYRFAIDALLLSAFALRRVGKTILDLGTGSGVLAIIMAAHKPEARVTGIEIQPAMVEMARRNVKLNGLEDRVEIIEGDLRHYREFLPPKAFDSCLANPPYRKLLSGRTNPSQEKAFARHEIYGSVRDFLAAASFALKSKGKIFIIFPAHRLVELFCQMRAYHLEPKRARLIYSKAQGRGEFVLVEGLLFGGEELYLEPPLTIYGDDKTYTLEMNTFLKNLASFP